MPIIQIYFFSGVAFFLLLIILSVIRKRMLRENYSLLWIFMCLILILIIVSYPLLVRIAKFFEASPTSLIMFGGMVALLLLIFQLSVMNSSQALQIKNLAQKIALIEEKIRKFSKNNK